jgi:DNA-binding response OmpR family regulator
LNPLPGGAAVLDKPSILHVCQREMVRPLRDQVLRISGFEVDSTLEHAEACFMFGRRSYNLVLIDVEGEGSIQGAETLCSEIKTARPDQVVAFVCNWRVAVLTDCPDEIVRTEFNPEAFVAGVRKIVTRHESSTDATAKSEQGTTL